jgi:deoxyribodipyrimidine photo-lyase
MSTSTGRSKVVLHWFRHGDLRLHDNQALAHSLQQADICIPIFCFDPKLFGDASRTPHANLKVGSKRAKFLLESVADLRESLQVRGSGICVTHEDPATFFGRLVEGLKDANIDIQVSVQEEVLREEKDTVKAVQAAIQAHSSQVKVDQIWGSTMYELEDLPFDDQLQMMPDVFTPFRNKVEKNCKIGIPLPPPEKIPLPSSESTAYKLIEPYLSSMPSLKDLAYTQEQIDIANTHDPRGVMEFKGGETAALARLKDYIWTKDRLKIYFETRNGMLGADYSTKLSPWLAHGCISPREVALQCRRYEEERVANKSTYWVVFELLWRDFCKFFCAKHGEKVFFPNGTAGKPHKWSTYEKNFLAWKEGRTGYPLVDANMREMAASGFMSNRGRQNVASFLALDLNHDWRMGGTSDKTFCNESI